MFITEYCAYLPWKAIYATKDDNVVAVGKHTYKKDKYNLEKMLVVCFFTGKLLKKHLNCELILVNKLKKNLTIAK